MERHDFEQAEKLWNKGIQVSASDPYAQFMRVKDRLQSVSGLQVTDWKVEKLQVNDKTKRYFGLIDIYDSAGNQFGIGADWQGEKWLLRTDNPQVPAYVRESLNGGKKLEQ